ncbi:thiol-activated cytolysin family protein [Echinicola shivajiensis]|uniref:thiol-activated cytolysin family protein n=1 Tax=Echinicola shivajiensis TaxID=1035916 RepID=UPI001BFC76AC|nr:thiol-activated cytolysin family protein [Echinicola shivajiensis]
MRKFLIVSFLAVSVFSCKEDQEIVPDKTGEIVWETKSESTTYHSFPLLNRDVYMQFPGALITLESISEENYDYVFNYNYNEVAIHTSLDGASPVSQMMIPSYGNFVEFENSSIYLNPTPPNKAEENIVSHEQWVKPIYSMDHLYMELGGNAFLLNNDVADKIKYGEKDGKSRGMFFSETINYSYNIEVPTGSSLIKESPDDEAFKDMTPVYVSKINMGKMAVVFFESSSPYEEVEAALLGLMDDKVLTDKQVKLLEETKFIVSVSRGWNGLEIPLSSEGLNDYEDFKSMLESGAEDPIYGEGKYGAIVSFELRHIGTNELAEATFSVDYEVPTVVE